MDTTTVSSSQVRATGPSSQVRAIDPYVHTLSVGLEKIHPEAFSSMAYRGGHRVCGVRKQTPTKFIIKTECIHGESDRARNRCQGTGNIQILLTKKGPVLFLAELNHDTGCSFQNVTLEDSLCNDETFTTNYCDYLSDAIDFASNDAKAKIAARELLLKEAAIKGYDVPSSDIASIDADNLKREIIGLSGQVVDYYSVPQSEGFWKI